MIRSLLGTVCLCVWASGCSKNLAQSATTNTTEEKARLALAAESWDEAIALYSQLIAASPEDYPHYPKLSTAYAGRSGINLVEIVKGQVSSQSSSDSGSATESGKSNVLDSMGQYVPAHPTATQMLDINAAIDNIKLMPEDYRIKDGPYPISSETSFTLNLYLSSSSAMLVNQYSETDAATGEINEEKLNVMSDQEVDSLFENLDSIVASGDEDLGPAVKETLDAINETPGATQKEKLLNYIASGGSAAGADSTSTSTSTSWSP